MNNPVLVQKLGEGNVLSSERTKNKCIPNFKDKIRSDENEMLVYKWTWNNLMFFWPCIMNWLYFNYQLDALIIIYS